jgi:replicative DNA helicase
MIQAERKVIGCLIMDHDSISNIKLEPDMFTDLLYRDIFTEYLRAYENHRSITETDIMQSLMCDSRPEHYLQNELEICLDTIQTSAEITYQAKIIEKEYKARVLGDYLNHVKPDAARIDDQIGDLINTLEALAETKETTATKASDLVDRYKDMYFRDKPEGLRTGFESLDDTLGDLQGGDMIVIGARPSVGKSALVTQIATYMVKQGKRVGFYNLEMKDQQIYERLLAAESGIGIKRIKRALAFTGDEQERFDKANEVIRGYKDLVINTGAKKISDIRAESRHMNYDIIIIDYMQLILPEDRYKGSRFAEVGQISHEIKALAMEFNIPVIALSQLNRLSAVKETKEPTMAELRESGDVEQDASIIMLMWNLTEDRTVKGLKVDKNRQGEVGKEKLNFEGNFMRFTEDGSEWTEAEDIPVFE